MRIILNFFGIITFTILWQCQKSQNPKNQQFKSTSQEHVLQEAQVTSSIATVVPSSPAVVIAEPQIQTPLPPPPLPPASVVQSLAPQSSAVNPMPTQLVLGLSGGIQAPTVAAWSISGTCATLPTIGGIYPVTTDAASWAVSLEGSLCQEDQTLTVQVDPAQLMDKNGQQVTGSLISTTYTFHAVGPTLIWSDPVPSVLLSTASTFVLPFTFNTGATVNATAATNPLLFTGIPTCKVELQNLAPTGGTLAFSGCTGDGSWSVQVQSGLVQDEIGNLSAASSALSFTVDTTPPTALALLPSSAARLKAPPSTIQAILSEPVQTPISPKLLGVSGCQSTPQVKNLTYDARTPGVQFQLSGGNCIDGDTLTVTLDPTQLVDLAGNVGTYAAISRTYTIHTVGPSLVITPPEKPVVNIDVTTTMQATWASSGTISASSTMPNPLFFVTAVPASSQELPPSCTFSLGQISSVGGSATATISLSQCTGSGTLSFSLTSGVVQDELGFPSSASSADTLLVDNTPPRLLSISPSTATRLNPFPTQVQATTTKPVSTLLSSLTSFFAISAASPCSATLSTPAVTTSGTTSIITASVSSSGCVDGNTMLISADPTKLVDTVGNRGQGSILQRSYTLQTKSPVATLTAPGNTSLSGSSTASIPVSWTSSGTISIVTSSFYTLRPNGAGVSCTVAADPIQLNGNSASTILRVSNCTGPGPITNANSTFVLSVNAGAVKDDLGNLSSASNGISFTVDSTPPTLVSYPTPQTKTSAAFTVPISLTMSEPITSSGAAVTFQNCSGGTVSSSGASGFLSGSTSSTGSITFNVSGCATNSTFTVTINPTLLQDSTGNVGVGSPLTLTYPIVLPPPLLVGSAPVSQPAIGSATNGDGNTITPTIVYGWRLSWGGASGGQGSLQYRVQYAYKQADNTMSSSTTYYLGQPLSLQPFYLLLRAKSPH